MQNLEKVLTVVTGNKSKAAEIAAITGWQVEATYLDILEVQSLDVQEVAKEKALAAYREIKRPVVVDDTGMSISALNGLPGALVSWFLDQVGPSGILKMIAGCEDRKASVSTCIGYADENGTQVFVGTISGNLAFEEKGTNGFGYDPIFVPEGETRTYAQMTSEEKNSHSMRKLALVQLKEFLAGLQ